jgi:hypothetical protein
VNRNLFGVHVAPKTKFRHQYQDNKPEAAKNEQAENWDCLFSRG